MVYFLGIDLDKTKEEEYLYSREVEVLRSNI
jgi:hypothetical protein